MGYKIIRAVYKAYRIRRRNFRIRTLSKTHFSIKPRVIMYKTILVVKYPFYIITKFLLPLPIRKFRYTFKNGLEPNIIALLRTRTVLKEIYLLKKKQVNPSHPYKILLLILIPYI